MLSPALRWTKPSGFPWRPDANTKLWLPGTGDPQSATIRDRSGNGNNGTIVGATWVKKNGIWGLSFDVTDDIVTVKDAATIQNITQKTFVAVLKQTPSAVTAPRLFEKGNPAVWNCAIGETDPKIEFYQDFDGATNGVWKTTNNCYTPGVLFHFVITYDNSATTKDPVIYVNGASVGLTETATPAGTRVTDAGGNLYIGNRAATDRPFGGQMYLFRLISGLWTQAQVTQDCNLCRQIIGF